MIREPWIRVHARLIDKPVVARMCAALNLKPPAAIGHLVTFWGSVAANAANGSLREVPDELLERWAAWTGKRGALATWVRESHMDEDGRVNDWDAYQGPLETRREKERRRVQAWREAQRNGGRTHDVTRTVTRNSTRNVAQRTGETERNGTERNKDQNQKHSPDADAPDTEPRGSWLAPFLDLWTKQVGSVTPKRAAAALAPVRKAYGDADTLAGLTAYLDEPRAPDKPVRLEYFAADAARWIAESKIPLVQNGVMTARGERLSRPTP